MSDEMKMTHPYEGNKCRGEIHVVLGTTDVGDSPTGRRFDLKVWLGGLELGGDDEPTVWSRSTTRGIGTIGTPMAIPTACLASRSLGYAESAT